MNALQFVNETAAQFAKHREIEFEDRRRKHRKRGNRATARDYRRITELKILFAFRSRGETLPDDDSGRDDLFTMANHLAHLDKPDKRIRVYAARVAPRCDADETDELIAAVMRKPLKWTADALAERLRLDDATRAMLGITTIGAIDCKKAKRAGRRRKLNTEAKRQRRLKAGAKPHAQSLSQTRPWEALSISRRTFERRRRFDANDANSGTAYTKYIVLRTNLRQRAGAP
jgi:hypothetical protein